MTPENYPQQFAKWSRVCFWFGLLGLMIIWCADAMPGAKDPTVPMQANFYHYTFTRFEPCAIYAYLVFFLGISLYVVRHPELPAQVSLLVRGKNLPLIVALGVLVVASVGRFAIHQNFDLCIDEYLNEFESRILDHQHLVATLPEEWRDYEHALDLPYIHYNADHGYWASQFLPGFASLDLLFETLHIDWALSPLLAALAILILARLANRAFPDLDGLAGGIAVMLLAFSPQFLAMAMTKFAWTAHLCGTLLWVWLLTHPNRRLFLLTPLLGVLLIGIHQPHVHFLVAAPFLIRLFFTFDWKALLWFGICYLAGCWGWYQLMLMLRPSSHGQVAELHYLAFPAFLSAVVTMFHAVTVLTWCTPIMLAFLFLMLGTWSKQPTMIRDCFFAAALTFLFYLSFPREQGHGWGYRYFQPAYGLLALAATGGAVVLCRERASALALKALAASVLFSVIVQFPYRAYEIRTIVRPLALTSRYLESQPTDFIVLQTRDFWYSWDLTRNDPWLLKRPLIFNGDRLTPAQIETLHQRGTVSIIGAKEVRHFGVIMSDPAKSYLTP